MKEQILQSNGHSKHQGHTQEGQPGSRPIRKLLVGTYTVSQLDANGKVKEISVRVPDEIY